MSNTSEDPNSFLLIKNCLNPFLFSEAIRQAFVKIFLLNWLIIIVRDFLLEKIKG
jgi:hypothetical protein